MTADASKETDFSDTKSDGEPIKLSGSPKKKQKNTSKQPSIEPAPDNRVNQVGENDDMDTAPDVFMIPAPQETFREGIHEPQDQNSTLPTIAQINMALPENKDITEAQFNQILSRRLGKQDSVAKACYEDWLPIQITTELTEDQTVIYCAYASNIHKEFLDFHQKVYDKDFQSLPGALGNTDKPFGEALAQYHTHFYLEKTYLTAQQFNQLFISRCFSSLTLLTLQ